MNRIGLRDTAWRAGLMARNGVRILNVIAARLLHRPPSSLPVALLFVTDRCNLRCKMCGVCEHEGPRETRPELTTEEWKAVIRSLVKLKTSIVSISGGEPLLRPDIFEIIRYGSENKLAVHMCTNGVLLDRDKALKLAESGVDAVSVSVESPDREVHETLRGPNTFDRTIEGIRLLREVAPGVRIGINYLITAINYRDMEKMIPFAESLGVHQIKFAPIHTNLLHRRKRLDLYGNLLFGEEDLEELEKAVGRLMAATKKTRLQTNSPMFLSRIVNLYSSPPRFRCYAGYAACAVNPVGVVTPCCDMDGPLSVRDMPLEEIWRSREFQELRRCVHHCSSSCWDTTNAELSIRMYIPSLLRDAYTTWKDVAFYFGKK